jgi:hypothetical protein
MTSQRPFEPFLIHVKGKQALCLTSLRPNFRIVIVPTENVAYVTAITESKTLLVRSMGFVRAMASLYWVMAIHFVLDSINTS